MDSEIRDVIYIAVASIILSIVLGFASFVVKMQSDIASSINDEAAGQESVARYNRYNGYDEAKHISGYKVIECITLNYGEITLYVCNDPADIGIYTEYNMDKFTDNSTRSRFDIPNMESKISKNEYKSYLLYNAKTPETFDESNITKYSINDVTGIIFIKE